MPSQDQDLRAVWTDPNSYALTLLTVFQDRFPAKEGEEIPPLMWTPETIVLEVEQEFGVDLPRLVSDRLLAAVALQQSNAFYKSLDSFIPLCNVLAGTPLDLRMWDPADCYEIAWGITEALLIHADEDDAEPFSDEIRAYIGAMLDEAGILNPPDILRLAVRNQPGGVPSDFTDDPDMFQAIYETERGKTDEINSLVRQHLRELLGQLQRLPLSTGDTAHVAQLLNTLTRMGQSSQSAGAAGNSILA